jgi:hypothetical protein
MNSIPRRPVIVGAVIGAAGLAAVIVALSLSGGSDPTASATTAGATTTSSPAAPTTNGRKGSGSGSTVSPAQGWHNLAQCFRSHGYAIADPTVNPNGTSSWSSIAGGGPPREVRKAERAAGKETCRAEWHALPPQAVTPPPTQAELHSLVLFAGCMRDHGLADWPDPNAQGAFPLNTRLLALGKLGIVNQLRACERHLPGGGIAVEHPGTGDSVEHPGTGDSKNG